MCCRNPTKRSELMPESRESMLEDQLRNVLGSPGQPDFDAWQIRHGDAVSYLNPIVTRLFQRRRRFLMSIGSAAVKPPVTEEQLIEWLEVTARFNEGAFLDTDAGVDHRKHNVAGSKD